MPPFHRLIRAVRLLVADRRASIAPMFALLLIPVLGTVGFSIDMSLMLAERARMQNIADAASINYMKTMISELESCGTSTSCVNYANYLAQQSNVTFFNNLVGEDKSLANSAAFGGSNGAYNSTTGAVTAEIHVTYAYPTSFMGIFGITTANLSVSSYASQTMPLYTQVIFLVDVSGSMGVAATATDMTNLIALTSSLTSGVYPCAFACHQSATGTWAYAPIDFRTKAKNAGIKLKIDYAQSAVSSFTSQMSTINTTTPGFLKAAIYTFSGTLNTIVAPTSNFTTVTNAVPNIDLDLYQGDGNVPYYGGTALTSALTSLAGQITNVGRGDGSNASNQLTYLILVSDGVEDTLVSGYPDGHKTDTTWTSACATIKSMNVNIATVQAQYVPFPSEQAYVDLVAPIYSQITPAMQKCASSTSNAILASDGPGITTAIDALFATFFSTPRLTQ